MAKDKGYERGIKEDADYGTQFLNASGARSAGEGEPPPPPPPTPGDEPPASRGIGLVVMVLLIVGAIGAGIAGFLIFGGGDDGSSGDLVTSGDVVIDENGFPVRVTTTTTEEPAPTTTTSSTTTTSTTLATTSTTAPTLPVPTTVAAPVTPPPTQGPTCPGGSSSTTLSVQPIVSTGDQFRLELTGTTTNNTTAAFDLTLVVRIQHEVAAGQVRTMEARTDQNGQSVPAGGSITWTATASGRSISQPQVLGAGGNWRWSDPQLASCPTGSFG
jgi:hypothetical protein